MALSALLGIYLLLYLVRNRIRNTNWQRRLGYMIAYALLIQEISLNLFRLWSGTWSVATSLPLHLCGLGVIFGALMLITESKRIYDIIYFWAIAGASQALLTPDIGAYGFPHFRYYQFFVSHGLIILAVLYMTFVYGYRPNYRALWASLFVLAVLLVPIAGINVLTGGNYFFIAHVPLTPSLIDYLGPWPYYIIWLVVLAIIMFHIAYFPMALSTKRQRRV